MKTTNILVGVGLMVLVFGQNLSAQSVPERSTAKTPQVIPQDLELVERIFGNRNLLRPMDPIRGKTLDLMETGWKSYWWNGDNALFNTAGFVVAGKTKLGDALKPYGMVGLSESASFESGTTSREGEVGVGVAFAFTEATSAFVEMRAKAKTAIPDEGIVRLGLHLSY